MDVGKICSNYTLFESVFSAPVEEEGIDLKEVQQDICAANININLLLEEIKANVAGITNFMDSVSFTKVA